MSIFMLLLILALIGGVAVVLVKIFKVEPPVAQIIYIVAGIACLLIALNAFGVHLPNPSVPQVH